MERGRARTIESVSRTARHANDVLRCGRRAGRRPGHLGRALSISLRYNRLKLHEVLWGGSICTPLRPIIPYCQGRGEDGLWAPEALRDWWQTGSNDIDHPRPDTISPLPEGIPLLGPEAIAPARVARHLRLM